MSALVRRLAVVIRAGSALPPPSVAEPATVLLLGTGWSG